MIQGSVKNIQNFFLPTFIATAVLVIALSLLTIVARSPYTQSNLNASFNTTYVRTEQIQVGAPTSFKVSRLTAPRASDPIELGRQLFITASCPTCHGLDGRGGIVAPPIVGMKANKLRSATQAGLKGMPAYQPGSLTDEDLEAIAAYLNSMGK